MADRPICTVQNSIRNLLGNNLSGLESPSLRLNKMLNYSRSAQNKEELDAICKCANRFRIPPHTVNSIPGMQSFKMKLAARMMIDQSGSILNLGILLHRNFSCPFIPGSALKGITRHFVQNRYGITEDFLRIFGENGNAGSVSFLSAFPVAADWKLVVDVLTKHNDPEDEMMDTKDPVPIFFPAVEKGCIFSFKIAPVKHAASEKDVLTAAGWLKSALKEYGVGAKTSAGYGWFKEA